MGTTVLILAKDNLLRAAWSALLGQQPNISLAGDAATITDLTRLFSDNQPTTVLIDVSQPQRHLVQELVTTLPEAGLLFLVDDFELADIVPMLEVGAAGFVHRDASVPELARAIIAAGRGEIVLPPEVAVRALAALARGDVGQRSLRSALTPREQDVLGLLAQGLTNKEIAQNLILSVRTVEAHLHNIYAKLDVSSRTEAALWAVDNGYAHTPAADD